MSHDQTEKPFAAIMHADASENNPISRPSCGRAGHDIGIACRVFIPLSICYAIAMIARFRFPESTGAMTGIRRALTEHRP